MVMAMSKSMSILDFVDKNNVNANNSVIPEHEMGMGDAIVAIGKGLVFLYRKLMTEHGSDFHWFEFTVPEILRYGGCIEYAEYKHSRDNADCVITVDLAKYAYNVLNTLAKYRYLEKNEGIVVTYTVNERSGLWKILRHVKSPVDLITFIREVMENE
jgi:hypothetical protein